MTATPLPGMPEPPTTDYEDWAAIVRPTFEAVAATGRSFVCWTVAREHDLPDPPNPKFDWARLVIGLHHDGILRRDGYGEARDHSAVRKWRGTRAAMRGAAA